MTTARVLQAPWWDCLWLGARVAPRCPGHGWSPHLTLAKGCTELGSVGPELLAGVPAPPTQPSGCQVLPSLRGENASDQQPFSQRLGHPTLSPAQLCQGLDPTYRSRSFDNREDGSWAPLAGQGLGLPRGLKSRAPSMVVSYDSDDGNIAFLWLLSCFALVGAAFGCECRDPRSGPTSPGAG